MPKNWVNTAKPGQPPEWRYAPSQAAPAATHAMTQRETGSAKGAFRAAFQEVFGTRRTAAPVLSQQELAMSPAGLQAQLEAERAAHTREVKVAADERAYVARHGMPRATRERLMGATPLGQAVLRAERAREAGKRELQ